MYYVHVLQSAADGQFYAGATPALKKRYKQPCDGQVRSTEGRCPLKPVYYEGCMARDDAIRRERYLQTGMAKRYLRNRLRSYLGEL